MAIPHRAVECVRRSIEGAALRSLAEACISAMMHGRHRRGGMRAVTVAVLGAIVLGMVASAQAEQEVRQSMEHVAHATVAGGCFWCIEGPFDQLEGVSETMPGYTGGTQADPTYEEVSSGRSGHVEAMRITYDPSKVTYDQLLDVFWRQIDPTQADGQFADHGPQYRTVIFYHDEEQHRLAEASKVRLGRSGKFAKPIVTEIIPASTFYPAEEYHRDYYKNHPLRYKLYHVGSGRAGFLKRTWGDDPASSQDTGTP